MRTLRSVGLAFVLAACSHAAPVAPAPATPSAAPASPSSPPDAVHAAVDSPDRTADDRALDAGRHPLEMLQFFGIKPGMRVAELGAGGGYTTELLARVVGPAGKVYGENNKFVLEKFAEKPWSERLAKPGMANVVRLDREFDSPFPDDVTNLDAVLIVLIYHDTVWLGADRAAMNAAVLKALKPGGVYGIVDHNAADGHGVKDVQTLHRIEESVVKAEVEKAGFRLDAEADFLRNPDDKRDWNDSPKAAGDKRGHSDRFVLRFVKP